MAPQKPIFVATHPRACSTAFERVFMTCRDTLNCVHEPFGDAFYFGPERLSERYEGEDNKGEREVSGFAESTYRTIVERLEEEGKEGKRLFIKDIAHYLLPPNGKPASIAPSLISDSLLFTPSTSAANGNASTNSTSTPYPYATLPEPSNPTVVPRSILAKFHFTFLIRHPRSSIPSYYRCTIPPLSAITGFSNFMPSEAGYSELRALFDYLKNQRIIGPSLPGTYEGTLPDGEVSITVVDADDLLDNPTGVIGAFCKEVGLEYSPDMLKWDTEEDEMFAREQFEKWRGFHEDAIDSKSLRPRDKKHKKKSKTKEDEDREWTEKYGAEGQKIIRECVDENVEDYEYLKSFALSIPAVESA